MIHQALSEGTSVSKDGGMPLAVDSSASDSSTVSRNSSPVHSHSHSHVSPISVPSPMDITPLPAPKSSPALSVPASSMEKDTSNNTSTTNAVSCGQNTPHNMTMNMNTSMPTTSTRPHGAVPDPISSSVGWSGIGVKNESSNNDGNSSSISSDVNVNVNVNMMANNTTVSVGGNANKNQSSAIAGASIASTTTNTTSNARTLNTTTTATTCNTTIATAMATGITTNTNQAKPQAPVTVAQIASKGGIRHNVGVKLESVPVHAHAPVPAPVPIPVTSMSTKVSDPISSNTSGPGSSSSPSPSSHVTPTGTPMPHTIQSIPQVQPTASVGESTNMNTNVSGHNMSMTDQTHMMQTKKSPRLVGMEDKSSSRSFTLSLPDPTSFSSGAGGSVPNACSSSVSVSTSSTTGGGPPPTPIPTAAAAPTAAVSSATLVSLGSTNATSAVAPNTTVNLPLSAQYTPMAPMSSTTSGPVVPVSSVSLLSNPPDRKQKRLQRNRESARLSRRRRKQYLEVLEERVNFLCEEMDRGRREHLLSALSNIRAMRAEMMNAIVEGVMASSSSSSSSNSKDHSGSNGQMIISQELYQKMNMLLDFRNVSIPSSGLLSRMSQELMLATTFGREYLKSLVIPSSKKYIMWLTLQNDAFFRGGRAASERLSAARIGEKLRSCGHTQVPPCNGMWPLFCNEVSLSYDQEERIRSLQREILSNQDTWLDRHTGAASEHILVSSHDAIRGAAEGTERRSKKLLGILSPEQKIKFLAWVARKKKEDGKKLVKIMEAFKLSSSAMDESNDDEVQVDAKRHDSANLYILNHKLGMIAQKLPYSKEKFPSAKALKKFTRRPAFESLATMEDGKGGGLKKGRKMSKDLSTTSLKRTSSEMSMDGNMEHGSFMKRSASGASLSGGLNPSLTPEMAQTTSASHVFAALGPISTLIPPNRLARRTTAQTQYVLPSSLTNEIPLMPDHSAQHEVTTTLQSHPAQVVTQGALQTQPYQTHTNTPQVIHNQPTSTVTRSISYNTLNTTTNQQPFTFSIPDPVPVLPIHKSSEQQPQQTLISSQSAPLLRQSNVPSPLIQPMTPVKEELPNAPLDDINFWGVSNQMADDSLFELTEEDWAIGEALF